MPSIMDFSEMANGQMHPAGCRGHCHCPRKRLGSAYGLNDGPSDNTIPKISNDQKPSETPQGLTRH